MNFFQIKSVYVQSDRPITVVGMNNQQFGTDGFLAYPVNSWGRTYFTMCYPGTLPSYFLIVSAEDNTKISIEPTVEIIEQIETPIQYILNKGQTFFIRSKPRA